MPNIDRYLMPIAGAFWGCSALAHLLKGEWLDVIGMTPIILMMLVINRLMDGAFQRGWTAASNRAHDDLLPDLTVQRRAVFLMHMRYSRRERREYEDANAAFLKEMSSMENPAEADVEALYRKYHRP